MIHATGAKETTETNNTVIKRRNRVQLPQYWFGTPTWSRRRQQRRKRHLKKEVALFQTLSHLCDLVQFVKCWQILLALVVPTLDSAINRITQLVFPVLIGWIVIYPVDSAIKILNNQGLALNSKRLYQSSGKEKESSCLVLTSSTKRELRHFHVVVVQ